MNRLHEGLKSHELDYLILPLVSIDEYKSKIDDRKAIVVGFYVTESDPANDLATFIEKGSTPVLDTDVSPAPTIDGYYLTFVEIDRNKKFPNIMMEIIKEINNITNIKNWEFSPYGSKETDNYELTEENIKKYVNLDPDSIEIDDDIEDENTENIKSTEIIDIAENINTFLSDGLFESLSTDDDVLYINQLGHTYKYKIVEYSYEQPDVPILIGTFDDPKMVESRRLQSLFGHNYSVYPSDNHILIVNENGYLLLDTNI